MITSAPAAHSGLLPRTAVSAELRAEMFALLATHFEGVTAEQFQADLAEKNWIIQIRSGGRLVGFSTLLSRVTEVNGAPLLAIYSGDTIVDPAAWNSPALARTWIGAVAEIRSGHAHLPCYWLLLASGFRTYRFLPVFWREFFPVMTPPPRSTIRNCFTGWQRNSTAGSMTGPLGLSAFPGRSA